PPGPVICQRPDLRLAPASAALGIMRRTGLILVVAALLAVAGCRAKPPGPAQTPTTTPATVGSTPTPSSGASASPTGSGPAGLELPVGGGGGGRVGSRR